MSALIRNTVAGYQVTSLGLNQNRDILQEPSYRLTEPYTDSGRLQDVDVLWTRSSLLGGGGQDGLTVGSGGILQSDCQRWEWYFPPTGSHVRKVVSGTVQDISGNPVSGATVRLFNTTTGILVDTQISASDGTYSCGDPNAVACFAVADIAGAPETAGTTVQTLTGT